MGEDEERRQGDCRREPGSLRSSFRRPRQEERHSERSRRKTRSRGHEKAALVGNGANIGRPKPPGLDWIGGLNAPYAGQTTKAENSRCCWPGFYIRRTANQGRPTEAL